MENIKFNEEKVPAEGFYLLSEIAGGKIFWVYFDGEKKDRAVLIEQTSDSFAQEIKLDGPYNMYQRLEGEHLMKNFILERIGTSKLELNINPISHSSDVEIILIFLSDELREKIKNDCIYAIEEKKSLTNILTQKLKKDPSTKFVIRGYKTLDKNSQVCIGSFLYMHPEKVSPREMEKLFKSLKLSPQAFYNLCRGIKKVEPIDRIKAIPIPEESVASRHFDSLRYVSFKY